MRLGFRNLKELSLQEESQDDLLLCCDEEESVGVHVICG